MEEKVNDLIAFIEKNTSRSNIHALIETGSTSHNTNTKNSDYDIRIIVEDYKLAYREIGEMIKACKTISLSNKDNYSEYKFYYCGMPIHLIFYNMKHVENCINTCKKSFISTILEGKVLYCNEKIFDDIYKECKRIKELIIKDESDLTSAKSLFVKAMSKYQNGYYEDSIFCFRYASIYLVKYYLLKKGIIFLKEQWILKSLRDICEKENNNELIGYFRKIHGLELGQAIDAKDCMINFTSLLAYVERYKNE